MTENRPFALESKTQSKERLLKKIKDLTKNKRYTIQTRKNVGGGPRMKRIKKAFTPSTPSTKSVFNPRRYLAYESTKKKRALQATTKSGIQFAVKHEHYRRGVELIDNYKKAKADAKLLSGPAKQEKKKEIEDLKKELKKIGVNSGNIKKALTQFTKKRDSYERKKGKSTITAETLKAESVNFIRSRYDYINKGQPELKNKLGALVSTDHTKMAMIKLPGVGNTPVSKLKYADFTNPKVTDAYLNQFKTVNASISKINKNFNINHLSENGKIELAKELHKITKDGIVDPAKQEEHFLKAVTDITYKDKVYSALDSSSKLAAKSYIAANPVKVYEDTPEPTMRQRHDEITKKLQNPDLTAEEKKHFEDELKYLNTELVVEPNDIQKQIDEARRRMTGETDYKQKNKIQDEITRLEARKEEIEKRNADDNIEAEKAIQEEIGKLKESTVRPEGLGEGITRNTIKEDLDTLDQKEKRLQEEYERKTETTEEDVQEFEKELEPIKNQRQALRRKLKAYEAYEKNQALIGQLTSMTPENRAKLEEELKGKDVNELKDILSAEQQKAAQFSNNPAIQRIIQRNVDNIQKTVNTKNLMQSVANNTELKPTQKDYIQTQITSGMTEDNVAELKDKVIADKELNYRLQKQQLTRLREEAEREKRDAKGRLVAARAEIQTRGILTRVGRKFKNAPDVKAAKRDIKEQRAQSAFLGRAERAWKPGTESYTRGRFRPFTKTRKISANTLERKLLLSQYPKKLDSELNTFKKSYDPNKILSPATEYYTGKSRELLKKRDAEIKAIEQKGDMTPKEKAKQIADATETYDGKLEALENWHNKKIELAQIEKSQQPAKQLVMRYQKQNTAQEAPTNLPQMPIIIKEEPTNPLSPEEQKEALKEAQQILRGRRRDKKKGSPELQNLQKVTKEQQMLKTLSQFIKRKEDASGFTEFKNASKKLLDSVNKSNPNRQQIEKITTEANTLYKQNFAINRQKDMLLKQADNIPEEYTTPEQKLEYVTNIQNQLSALIPIKENIRSKLNDIKQEFDTVKQKLLS